MVMVHLELLMISYVWKKEYQKHGAVQWHMLLWCKPGTIPNHCIMAELPRSSDPNNSISAYLRKIVHKKQRHCRCVPERLKVAKGSILVSMVSLLLSLTVRNALMRKV